MFERRSSRRETEITSRASAASPTPSGSLRRGVRVTHRGLQPTSVRQPLRVHDSVVARCSVQVSASGPIVSVVTENVSVGVASERVLVELADVLTDKLDQLLDRLVDRALAAPTPGSARWESEWNTRYTMPGRARSLERSRLRAELVRRAYVGLGMVGTPPPPPPEPPVVRERRARTDRGRVDDDQLTFF